MATEMTTEMKEAELKLRYQRETVEAEYRYESERAKLNGREFIYSNQKEAALECMNHYANGKILVLVVAQPGTGKTGTFVEISKQLTTHIDDNVCVKTDNIYIISGMNDTDWRTQFQSKMLRSFQENIHHRSILGKQIDNIASIRNGLLSIDECHIASGKNMTVAKVLKSTGLTDIRVVQERNVRLLDISATPESIAWDLESWGDKAVIVRLMPGSCYKGFQVMLDENRIREAPSFSEYETVSEWFRFFEERYRNTSKRYFPIRITDTNALGHIRRAIVAFGWTELHHDSKNRIEDIDAVMGTAPSKHTVIMIKGFWRASKRLVRTHIGGSYEQIPRTRNVTTATQSTIGRFCDNFEYTADETPEVRPVHFGDRTSIEMYLKWFNDGCDFRKSDYTCTRIKSNGGMVHAQASKNHISIYKNMDAQNVPKHETTIPVKMRFMDQELLSRVLEIRKKSKSGYKDILHPLLLQGIAENKIVLDDKNQIKFDICERTLKTVRMYEDGDKLNVRRFKNFNDAFENNKNTSQAGTIDDYSIDFAYDDYVLPDFENPREIAWITFTNNKKEEEEKEN